MREADELVAEVSHVGTFDEAHHKDFPGCGRKDVGSSASSSGGKIGEDTSLARLGYSYDAVMVVEFAQISHQEMTKCNVLNIDLVFRFVAIGLKPAFFPVRLDLG